MQGHLALSFDPSWMGWDLAWGRGAVQQVWGLGIPLWQLPFNALAKAFGQPAFPDRLAFVIALAGVIYFVARFHLDYFSNIRGGVANWFNWLRLLPVFLFPPFLSLCSSRFFIYEEVVAYGFLIAVFLMTWTVWLWLRPNPISFFGLALMSGFIIFVRPTFAVYGVASVLVASFAFWKNDHRFRLLFLGGILFCVGGGLILWLNTIRFGSCLEFGYALNVNGLSPMVYAQRFDDPYHAEPLSSAAKELFALLFLTKSSIGIDPYGFNCFPGQSSTFRWKELYFNTYDLSYFIIFVTVLGWVTWRLLHLWRRRKGHNDVIALEAVALWSVLASAPLAVFYLRFPFISSRYLMDFSPAFSGALWVFLGLLSRSTWFGKLGGKWIELITVASLLGWWGYEIMTIETSEKSNPFSQQELIDLMRIDASRQPHKQIPYSYTNGFEFDELGIFGNGAGWNQKTGNTESCVLLYVENPEDLNLEMTLTNGAKAPTSDYNCIQAKIGLEYLKRKDIVPTPSGVRIEFYGPTRRIYKTGIQQATIAMVAPRELSLGNSRFRLLKVSWHQNLTNAPP